MHVWEGWTGSMGSEVRPIRVARSVFNGHGRSIWSSRHEKSLGCLKPGKGIFKFVVFCFCPVSTCFLYCKFH